jgi:hypothetical protein
MAKPPVSAPAVMLAAVAAFVIGFLWYSPFLFGNLWVQGHGYTPEQLAAMQTTVGRTYGIMFLCLIVSGVVLSLLLHLSATADAAGGARLGFLGWLGFAATTGLSGNLFGLAPLSLYAIDTAYQLVYFVAMGAILGYWRGRKSAH